VQLLRFQLVFDEIFRLIADIAFIALSVAMYRFSVKQGQRHHLYWIVPWIVDDALSLLYRISSILSFVGIWHRPPVVRAVIYFGLDIATCLNVLGLLMLYQVLRAGKLPTVEDVSDPDVWPPTPQSS